MFQLHDLRLAGSALFCLLCVGGQASAGVGEVDASWGDGGQYKMPFDSSSKWHDLVVLPDGRVMTAIVDVGNVIRLFRTDANGRPDASFGVGGEKILAAPTGAGAVFAMAVAPGNAVFIGIDRGVVGQSAIARLTPAGEIDQGFGQGGWVNYSAAAVPNARAAVIDSIAPLADGGVAVLVAYYNDFYDDCALAQYVSRLQADGSAAPGLAPIGFQIVPYASSECYEIRTGHLRQMSGGALRYSAGSYHMLFDAPSNRPTWYEGLPGVAYYSTDNHFTAVAEPDVNGRFDYVMRDTPNPTQVEVVRLLPNRTVDYSFAAATGGRTIVQLRPPEPEWTGNSFMTQGFLEAGGGSGQFIYLVLNVTKYPNRTFPRNAVVVVRLLQDGTVDESFGEGGQVWILGGFSTAGVLAEQPDGSCLLQLGSWGSNTVIRLLGTSSSTPGLIELSGDESVGASRGVVNEGATASVWATRSAGSHGDFKLSWRVVSANATAWTDYQDISGEMYWTEGATGTIRIDIPVLQDNVINEMESFEIRFWASAGDAVLVQRVWRFDIRDGAVPTSPTIPPPVSSPAPASPSTPTSSTAPTARTTSQSGGGGAIDYAAVAGLALLVWALRGSPRRGIWPSRRNCRSRSCSPATCAPPHCTHVRDWTASVRVTRSAGSDGAVSVYIATLAVDPD